jgi:hypothetical protein
MTGGRAKTEVIMGSSEKKAGGPLFRKKALTRIASPEELNDYLKVTNPANWMILGSIIAILIGIIVWSFAGNLNTYVSGEATAEDGQITANIVNDNARFIREGQTIMIGEKTSKVFKVEQDEFGRTRVEASMDIPDGEYMVKIVIEQITPFELLFN